MLNIILFGPPGAGKGTQAALLIGKYELVHLSTGDILRAERKAGTVLGKEADGFIEAGELVPDGVVIGMVRKKIEENPGVPGFIFDGFPRTLAQGEALDKMLAELSTSITLTLSLEAEEEELARRLLLRGKDSGRADDRDEETIHHRFRVYQRETQPLKDFYSEQGKLRPVCGIGRVEDIFGNLCSEIDLYRN